MKKKFSVINQACGEHASNMFDNSLHYKILENQIENIKQVFNHDMIVNSPELYDFDQPTDSSKFDTNIQQLASKRGVQIPQA